MTKLEEAIKCYSTAIQIKPHFADAYANLAATYKDIGDYCLISAQFFVLMA
jgi:protein O-GlcNAc transferase